MITVSVIAVILVLGALIFFHELGHFSVAKSLGIGVRTFSLGFGKKLFGFVYNRTEYRVSAVPLGGYVQLVGEAPGQELPPDFKEEESFSRRPASQRLLVVSAGPVFNFLLAWVIYVGIFFVVGQTMLAPVVGEVEEGSPAARAGIQAGDTIKTIDGDRIEQWGELAQYIRGSAGEEFTVEVSREGEIHSIEVSPEIRSTENIFGEEVQMALIGVQASGERIERDLGPLEATVAAAEQTGRIIYLTVVGIGKLIERAIPLETLGGPILIAQLVGEQAQEGLVDVLGLAALISINLGIINLLPIPVLDGGHIIFNTLEMIRRKPLDPKWQDIAMRIGLSLIIALMILVIYNDLRRIIG